MAISKRFKAAKAAVDSTKLYDVKEGLELAIKNANAKFDESMELHLKLGVDGRNADQQVRGVVVLPNGTGKKVRVLVIAKGDKADEAEKAGADAMLVVTPYYNKCSQRGLVKHYQAIADNTSKPIIIYNVPSRTGVNVLPTTYAELCEHKNIIATKEASGNISQIAETIALCGDKLDVYSGNDDQIVPLMSLGGKGVISVLSNICPKLAHDIPTLYLEGKVKEAADLQLKYLDLINAMFMDVNPIPVKVAMNMMGFDVGPLRMPLCEMDDAKTAKLESILKKYNLI